MDIYHISSYNLKRMFLNHKNNMNLHMNLSYDPAISLRFYSREIKAHAHKKSCTRIFIAALFILAKTGNNPNTHQ